MKINKSIFVVTGFIGIGIFLLFFVATGILIGREVDKQCQIAKENYGQDCVESLVALLNDENRSFRLRNSAIWALGQLGDKHSLPFLQKYYTGHIPEKEPLDKMISQYELKKAIKLVSGGLNMTAFIWRNN